MAQVKISLKDYYQPTTGKTAKENLDSNIEPVLGLFGHYAGGGLFHTAETHSILGFDVGARAIVMFIGDNAKTEWKGQSGVEGGPLGDRTSVPLPVIHASVGLGSGLELMGRFFSAPIAETAQGKKSNLTLLGAGLKYGLVQNMLLPRVTLIAAYHKLVVPEEFEFGDVGTVSLDLVISKGIPMLMTFYGGVGVDRTSMSVNLEGISDTFDYAQSKFRGVVGLKLDFIPFIYINADYNFGPYQGLNVGLGLSLR
jgi:hypothetical protein